MRLFVEYVPLFVLGFGSGCVSFSFGGGGFMVGGIYEGMIIKVAGSISWVL